jgi:hypothetical protein
MTIFKYKKVITGTAPNTTTLGFKFDQHDQTIRPTHLAEVNNIHYVFVPESLIPDLPEQHTEIEFAQVELTPELKDQIKKESSLVKLINDRFSDKLRAVYSLDDEQYFSRIGIGSALGIYTFQPGEEQALIDFGTFVENLRTEKRNELSSIGL